ncbi:DUF3857 domain-containing protein [Trinickia dinghuensis]|uniref:DUF3857 domain-containing protein n=1 Tax=Trinickia dinghuensis TaxID=2291023 RepID=A0A3D8JY40_9BURK|nr:DUF3857 domain-containing protein [Trinickia dinghuensis]RDU97732.1 DUF3857 domain-containing protein [Trinickia dinghuensis]
MALASSLAHASAFQPDLTVLSDDIAYDVHADGTFTDVETESIRIDTKGGALQAAQIPLLYSKTLQDLTVEEAYTTTPDGKRIDVTPDRIFEQQSSENADASSFDDGRLTTVMFPALEVGATVTLRTRRTERVPLFPGQFSATEHFRNERAFKSATVTVRAPSTLKLYVDAVGMSGGRAESGSADTQIWHWSLSDTPAHAQELGSVFVTDVSPRVAVTTFPSYAALGAAYLKRAEPKAAVTPAIRTLADRLTEGVSDPKVQAERIYDWVSTHIRYDAFNLGAGGIVPHDADSVLKNEFGDCKDHATLLQALLAAKGIRSAPVLVNDGEAYWLPKAAAPLAVFNHVMTYLPDLKTYADTTTGVARFGTLSYNELGKPALVTDNGMGNAEVVTLPTLDANSSGEVTTLHVTLESNGDLNGTAEVEPKGTMEWVSRKIFSSFAPIAARQVAKSTLSYNGEKGTGDYHHGDVYDLSQPFVYQSEFQVPQYARFPGPGAIQVPLGTNGFGNIASIFPFFEPETCDFAMPFPNRHVVETTILTLPDGVKPTSLPLSVDIASPLGAYRSSYAFHDGVVTVIRDLTISHPGVLVQPDQYPALRKMALAVQRDFHSRITY